MSADSELSTDTSDDNKLVKPKVEFRSLLQHAGATKDVFTMKEVMFYLGQYIIQNQLYDQKQQHIVQCSHDALGRVLGVDSFSVKEPRVLFAMITKNLVAVKSQESPPSENEPNGNSQTDRGTEEAESESRSSSPDRRKRRRRRGRRRRSCRSNEPGPSHSVEDDEDEEESEDEEEEEGRKRRRSDSFSFTFDDSLSWCVIGGLGGKRDRHSSQSSESHSTSGRSEVTVPASDSESDNFSVEFEVESADSDDYNEDDTSLSADDQVYEVTIFEAEDDDSFDEDTEITEADYWRCVKCDELNPPLPRNCLRCWTLRRDWLPEESLNATNSSPSSPKALPKKPTDQSAAKEASGTFSCSIRSRVRIISDELSMIQQTEVPMSRRTKESMFQMGKGRELLLCRSVSLTAPPPLPTPRISSPPPSPPPPTPPRTPRSFSSRPSHVHLLLLRSQSWSAACLRSGVCQSRASTPASSVSPGPRTAASSTDERDTSCPATSAPGS
nr:PREDICTED: E3 ubiquitin-protein ligase Mdm2 isoform X1 [Paralichthys olivaceus]XP_019964495.1 PREDICTED: E3 ubiquitin-protein ligase Mdm2 isoform X1 [Paralichthys olivaceus]